MNSSVTGEDTKKEAIKKLMESFGVKELAEGLNELVKQSKQAKNTTK